MMAVAVRLDGDIGACQPTMLIALAATATAVVSSRDALLYGVICKNTQNAVTFLQVFDVATAGGVTVGTTTPSVIVPLSALQCTAVTFNKPVKFANGIQAASTTTSTGNSGAASDYVFLTA